MTNTAQSTTTRQAFEDALMAVATPHLVGTHDAEHGNGDRAADRYTKEGDVLEYREGYALTRLAMAQQRENRRAYATESKPRMLTLKEMEEANADYAGDIADRQRHSRGMW